MSIIIRLRRSSFSPKSTLRLPMVSQLLMDSVLVQKPGVPR